MHQNREDFEYSNADDNSLAAVPQEEHSRKRFKKDNETTVVRNTVLCMRL
jgi:hypothetical protein